MVKVLFKNFTEEKHRKKETLIDQYLNGNRILIHFNHLQI